MIGSGANGGMGCFFQYTYQHLGSSQIPGAREKGLEEGTSTNKAQFLFGEGLAVLWDRRT